MARLRRPLAASTRVPAAAGTHAPELHLLLTLVWAWSLWGGAAALGGTWERSPTGLALFSLGGLGPALIASLLVGLRRSDESLRRFWRRVLDPRSIRARWYLAIAAVAFAPAVAGRLASGAGGDAADIPPLVAVLGIALVAALSEEPGWRGYAQEGLERRWPVATAAVVVGTVWAAWHLPLFFIEGTYQERLGLGSVASWQFLGSVVPLSVVYAWIYAGTEGSTAAAVLAHVGQNLAAALWSVPRGRAVELAVIAALAVAVVSLDDRMRKRVTASGRERAPACSRAASAVARRRSTR